MNLVYSEVRRDIKDLDILLFRGGRGFDPLGWSVKAITHSPYTHAGFAVWVRHRLFVYEAWLRVMMTPLSTRLAGTMSGVDLYRVNLDLTEVNAGLDEAFRFAGRGYDYLGLLKFGWSVLRQREPIEDSEDRVFCSEMVARVLRIVGVNLPHPPDFISPADIGSIATFVGTIKP